MHQPEKIYFNGEIHTLSKDKEVVEAIAVQNGRISALGDYAKIRNLRTKDTAFVDLKGKTMIPGLTDAHLHIFPLGTNLLHVDCRLTSIKDVVAAIQKQAAQVENEKEWIIGWGFDESQFKEGRKLTKWDFKDIQNPVYITRYCLHEAVVNEKALELAQITNSTTIANGIIEQDNDGEVTGLLIENALTLIENMIPPYTDEKLKKAILLAQQYLLEKGITSAHDAGLGFFEDPYREYTILRKLNESGELCIRMYLMVLAEYFKDFKAIYDRETPSDRLVLGAMKLFADGTLSGRNAALSKPYKDSTEHGMLLYSDENMKMLVEMAHQMGEQVAVHAIGDRAIEQVLRIYEQVQQQFQENRRHRIEHAFMMNDTLLQQMAKLGAVPIPQPSLLYTAGDVHHQNIGEMDIKYMPLRSFKQYGLRTAASSDCPVVDANPMLGIFAAMKRESLRGAVFDKRERLTLKEAIRMYTVNAAYAAFQEKEKGTIELGKLADFTILPAGFMNYTADEVKETKVEMTIIHGEICYQK